MRGNFSLITAFVFLVSMPCSVFGDDHHTAKYVPWGVDEYELLALTPAELSSKFKGKLSFEEDYTHAYMWSGGGAGPQFLLELKDGRVASVQRLFIDGGGCHILGPKLISQREALEFSLNGLSKLQASEDQVSLRKAQELLKKLDQAAKPTSAKKSEQAQLK
jgi:hypothetical protein